jgi:hypothetical protein
MFVVINIIFRFVNAPKKTGSKKYEHGKRSDPSPGKNDHDGTDEETAGSVGGDLFS